MLDDHAASVPGTAGMSARITLVDEKFEIGCDASLKRFLMAIA